MPATYRSKPRSRIPMLFKMAVVLGFLLALGAVSAYFGMRVAVRGTEVVVPPVVGMNLEDARRNLAQADLGLRISGERYAHEAPAGAIVLQHPSAGGRMKAGRDVQVIVSLGVRVHPVPDLVGASLRAAQVMAAQAGYQLGSVSQIDVPEGSGDIIQQFPKANSSEIGSGRIDVLLGAAPSERYIMPDLTGEDLNRAGLLLERSWLRMGKVEYRQYQGATRGTVVRQFPEPGYPVRTGEPVHLEVAR